MTCSDRAGARGLCLTAGIIGPAASTALAPEAMARPGCGLHVHSVFPSTINLTVDGSDFLVSLTGPEGEAFPHAVALRSTVDFRSLQLAVGDPGRLVGGCLRLKTKEGTVSVDIQTAARPIRRVLPTLSVYDRGGSFSAAAHRLVGCQAAIVSDLRIDAIVDGAYDRGRTIPGLGAALCRAACALLSDVRPAASPMDRRGCISRHVSALLGAGRGLTPSGDDFLCGFLAAARSSRPPDNRMLLAAQNVDAAVCESIEEGIASTGDVSATLLRLAIAGFWPGPLAALADGFALGERQTTREALDELCAIGHSSGADIATGFLAGHSVFLNGDVS